MKTKKVVTTMLLLMLSICLVYGLTACGSSKGESTVVGNWSCTDESKSWTLGFTEDGDFYDSNAYFMSKYIDVSRQSTRYGTWNIRADGRLWFTGTLSTVGWYYGSPKSSEFEWGYSYELDGDTLKIGEYTFKRVK